MRTYLLASFLLVGCGNGLSTEQDMNGYVISANDDPANFTPSGRSRHRYAACGQSIELHAPFEVVSGSWNDLLAVPLSYLDNPQTKKRPPEGVDETERVSFGFPARYRGEGLWEWQARSGGQRFVKPIDSAAFILTAAEAKTTNISDGETRFQGIVGDLPVAMLCTQTNVPNPSCDVEVKLAGSDQRFGARFPPRALSKLPRIVAIGQDLFNDVAGKCTNNPPARSTEIRIYPSRSEAERSSSVRPDP